MARLALGVAGAAAGFAIGGPTGAQIGWTLGTVAGSIFFPEKLPGSFGPQINDLQAGTSNEGADMPIIWGTVRLAGNRIWSAPRVTHTHEEETGGKGGPTSTHTSYTYTQSFCISFGRFESTHVRRIWANKKLIYDARSGANTVATVGLRWKLYTGTTTQAASSLMESHLGSGNVPAYRGQTLIEFTELKLDEYNGQIPSVEAEITTSGTNTPSEVYISLAPNTITPKCQVFDVDNELYWQGYGAPGYNSYLVAVDPYSKTIVRTIDLGTANGADQLAISGDYLVLRYGSGITSRLAIYNKNTMALVDDMDISDGADPIVVGSYVYATDDAGGSSVSYLYSLYNLELASPSHVQGQPTGWVVSAKVVKAGENKVLCALSRLADGEPGWATFTPFESDPVGVNYTTAVLDTALAGYTASSEVVYDSINDLYWWLFQDAADSDYTLLATDKDFAHIYEYNLEDMTGENLSFSGVMRPLLYFDSESNGIWLNATASTSIILKFDVLTHELSEWPHSLSSRSGAAYHAATDSFITGDTGASSDVGPVIIRVNAITATDYPVADIIGDICDLAGLAAADISVGQVTDTVIGYRHSRRVSARSDIEPLLNVFFIDAVQSDYKLKFIPRGGASVATIPESDLAAHEDGTDIPVTISHVIPQGIDIPKSLDLQYLSADAAQQPAVARAQWVTGHSERSASLSVAVVFSDQDAIEITDSLHMQGHDVERFNFSTSRKWSKLDPGDVVTVPVDDKTYDVLLTGAERGANGLIQFSASLYGSSNQTSYADGGGAYADNSVEVYGPANAIIIDSGLLRDSDEDHPGPYIAAYNYTTGFPAVGVYRSTDGSDFQAVGSIVNEPTIGRCATVPADVDFEDWDTTNSLVVDFINGTPSTITDAQVLAGGNAVAWGQPGRWEIIQFATKTLVSGTQYTITRHLRGRRGTDWAMGLHAANDLFVLISSGSMMRVIMANSDIGSDRWFRLPSANQAISDAATHYWVTGNNPLMPYSVSDPSAAYSAGTGWEVEWTRRTRRGGTLAGPNTLTDGVGGSVSEDSELYEVDVFLQSDPDTILRTYTPLSTPDTTYTDAHIAADGLTEFDDVGFNIYQKSSVVGRGYVRELLQDGVGVDLTITNPGAESNTGHGTLPTGWTNNIGAEHPYSDFSVFSGNARSGSFAFWMDVAALGSGVVCEGYQNIDVSSYSTGIDAGTGRASFIAWLDRYNAAHDDYWQIGMVYRDSGSAVISETMTGFANGVTVNSYERKTLTDNIPVNTRSIDIVLSGRTAVSDHFTYIVYDDLELKVYEG